MILFPAIDIYESRVVRLFKGDFEEMTSYHDDVLAMALAIEEKGAGNLHVVDLEGAKKGEISSFYYIKKIVENTGLSLEVGGGIRDFEGIEAYLSLGVDRIVLGTRAIKDRGFLKEAIRRYGEKIVAGLDIKEGRVAVNGWMEVLNLSLTDCIRDLMDLGVKNFIVTDIGRDGAMRGINYPLYEDLIKIKDINLTASGGISSMDDLRSLKKLGLYGAILGKAMYTGAVDLREALSI